MTGNAAPGAPVNAASTTPTLRAVGRRSRFWIVAGTGVVIVAIVGTLLAGAGAGGAALSADNPAPAGSRALVEVLRGRGVTVTIADTLASARAATAGTSDPTVFFYDARGFLTAEQLTDLAGLAPRTVVADPDFRTVQTLAPGLGFGGVSNAKSLTAQCTRPAMARAGTLTPGGRTLTIRPGATGLTGCFPTRTGVFSVVERETAGGTITFVAPAGVFRNDSIGASGNAALALNLLGAGDTLVWYLPTVADVARTGPPSLGELTPGWVTPVLALLILVTLAAAVWRGRRFGPLVAENLPVTVRASETMEGRARLYARGNARLRAIDAVRIGAAQRLAARLGLARTAALDDIVNGVAAVTGKDPAAVRTVLVDAIPASDAQLIALSDAIQDLERAVTGATTPHQHGRMDP